LKVQRNKKGTFFESKPISNEIGFFHVKKNEAGKKTKQEKKRWVVRENSDNPSSKQINL